MSSDEIRSSAARCLCIPLPSTAVHGSHSSLHVRVRVIKQNRETLNRDQLYLLVENERGASATSSVQAYLQPSKSSPLKVRSIIGKDPRMSTAANIRRTNSQASAIQTLARRLDAAILHGSNDHRHSWTPITRQHGADRNNHRNLLLPSPTSGSCADGLASLSSLKLQGLALVRGSLLSAWSNHESKPGLGVKLNHKYSQHKAHTALYKSFRTS